MAKNDDLSLSGLSMPELDTTGLKARFEASMAESEEYMRLYGAKKGWEKYCEDKHIFADHNVLKKDMNEAIYEGRIFYERRMEQNLRMMELFGDEYEILKNRGPRDSRVAELLVEDAVRTGEWKELPDELQVLYHERVGDAS